MRINGLRMNDKQFMMAMAAMRACNIHLNPNIKTVDSEKFLEMVDGRECFEIQSSQEKWSTVIHNCVDDETYYFKDERFFSHNYACKKAFLLAIEAHGGKACQRCQLHHRDIDTHCDLCAKVVALYSSDL